MARKRFALALALLFALVALGACSGQTATEEEESQGTDVAAEPVTLTFAAAASLKNAFDEELIPAFTAQYPNVTVTPTYAASGTLQTQIEEGMDADVFMSAAMTQMNNLKDAGLVDADSIVSLLENEIVLIVPADSTTTVDSFNGVTEFATFAVGDPESVPAGKYAQEALTSLGLWDSVAAKASLGSDVTQVLNWVSEGSAEGGIVYRTDAISTDKVKVIAVAPEGSLASKVIYPIGIVSASQNKETAAEFIQFLQTSQAASIFEKYGFKLAN